MWPKGLMQYFPFMRAKGNILKKAIFEIGEERANRAIAELGSWKSFTKLAKGGTVLDFD